jgi:2-polyprenyl-3-methyl-5-hydroxy-6-metoxy-1,4-benzoquinol methylase
MLNLSKWLYDFAYRFSTPRWDNGKISPTLVTFVEQNPRRGRALDLGCGTGTQSLYLAQHGWTVVGVDLAPKALELARVKAQRLGVTVDFQNADVTQIEFLREPFDLVLDLGCFHGLGAAGRKRYVQNLARLTHAGSAFLLYAFEHHSALGIGVTSAEIAQRFTPPWTLRQVEQGIYLGGRVSWCYRLDRP